jgi:hypothetical protein
MPFQTLELPAGTELTKIVPIARNGDWSGLTRVRITTSGANATIHSWEFINDSENSSQIKFRRVGIKGQNNWYNRVLPKDEELGWWAAGLESLVKLVYTSTNPISFIYETQVGGYIFPQQVVPILQWNKQADAKPWVTNLSPNNPTEHHISDGTRDALGVTYWKPRVG